MIKTFMVSTSEIDDIELAAEDIISQLDKLELCANTIGILSCHYEFIYSGAMKAICESIPFEVAGAVTASHASGENMGILLLTIMILTSDDVYFSVKSTPSLHSGINNVLEKTCEDIFSENNEKPTFAFSFFAHIENFPEDEYVSIFTRVSGGVPCFGTVALESSDTFEHSYVCVNGEHYRDRAVMILVYGNLQPRFLTATISAGKILPQRAMITKSDRNILMEVNGYSVHKYLEDLGVGDVLDMQYASSSLPFFLDYGDGTPMVSRVFIDQTPEKYAVSAGILPEGATMYVGVFDKEDVLLTTSQVIDKALGSSDCISGMLMYSCMTRSISLGGDIMAELELVKNKIGNKFPFMMSYSGGEICPVQNADANYINRCHNNTFILCMF